MVAIQYIYSMEMPLNVVPMPADQRAELKRLAQAATGGPWAADGARLTVERLSPGRPKEWVLAAFYDFTSRGDEAQANTAYIAAVSPDIALATISYVEALEAEVKEQAGRLTELSAQASQWRAELAAKEGEIQQLIRGRASLVLDMYESQLAAAGPGDAGWFSPLVFDSAAEYDASVADVCRRIESGEITPRQVELNSLHRCPLCDESPCGMCPEHAQRLAPTTVGEAEPAGDGGIQAMQELAAYFAENGNKPAYAHIRAAAHNAGWCIDNGGADKIDPTTTRCPLCQFWAHSDAVSAPTGGEGSREGVGHA
jgi:hypothetical protein